MEYFINKNLLIDDLLELEISYVKDILDIFEELRNKNDFTYDNYLFIRCTHILDSIIFETGEYLQSIVDLEFEYNYVSKHLNDLYIGRDKIQKFINNINEIDIFSEIFSEFNIK